MKVEIQAIEPHFKVKRVIGHYGQGKRGPGVVVTAGIHGNEPSGIAALNKVFKTLEQEEIPMKGQLLGLTGNYKAVSKQKRFIHQDLNRVWTKENIKKIKKNKGQDAHELTEMAELLDKIKQFQRDELITQMYFLDCHTTSSQSQPYISVHEFPHSFFFAAGFPLYSVKGISQYIPGTIDDYLNSRGYIGFTFEAGQHDDISSIENHEAVIWLMLAHTGCIDYEKIERIEHYREQLSKYVVEGKKQFRVVYCYKIKDGEEFRMKPGFINFQKIIKGQVLAENRKGEIVSRWDGRILMPLYQSQGDDGFFVVEEIFKDDKF